MKAFCLAATTLVRLRDRFYRSRLSCDELVATCTHCIRHMIAILAQINRGLANAFRMILRLRLQQVVLGETMGATTSFARRRKIHGALTMELLHSVEGETFSGYSLAIFCQTPEWLQFRAWALRRLLEGARMAAVVCDRLIWCGCTTPAGVCQRK